MTKEQEEAISTMQHWIDYEKRNKDKIQRADELINMQETILSMLQEQQEANKKKDKIIEEMAKFMTNKDIDEDICRYQVVEHCKDEKYGVTTDVCINCIKQYFERKVEE